jgi:hypothetical protein
MPEGSISPCGSCVEYSKYSKDSIYFWAENKLEEPKYDMVDKPKHYMLFPEQGIEVRDIIKKLVDKMQDSTRLSFTGTDYADYFQAMQYFMRFMEKNGKEDLEKGVWYMNKLIEAFEE